MSQRGSSIRGPPEACQRVVKPAPCNVQQADDWSEGFCLACRAPRDGCEPDAEAYECEECGEAAVYGPHWIAIAGLFGEGG